MLGAVPGGVTAPVASMTWVMAPLWFGETVTMLWNRTPERFGTSGAGQRSGTT
ncbi:hypothetical protein P3102_20350 [Amycolatopsis sp. QT-25]|uniref:hypothetical protein n=1 Tax=Amycolatopsis sp. QT-25 TaxID=3034022 RepID=UPI0023EA8E88|nr:hypothetical protein [Amycolatopsis sp. QT-25]WET76479.1 hypothetical protein P3102_20350 [Amycolatopsis sp. QT-25]